MKIVHSVGHIHDEDSGPSYSVPALAAAEGQLVDCPVSLICQGSGRPVQGVVVRAFREFPLGCSASVSFGGVWAAAVAARHYDVHHSHGLWRAINVFPSTVGRQKDHLLVVSPRGTLLGAAFRQKHFLKRLFWPLQQAAIRRAGLLHATSWEELEAIRQLGFRQPVVVLPNGIDCDRVHFGLRREKVVVYLGRLYRGKGIELLIRCWGQLGSWTKGWRLVLAGSGTPTYESHLGEEIRNSGASNIEFRGPVFGQDKWRLLASSAFLALLSDSENFGMAVAEAVVSETPVLVGKGAPWAVAEAAGFGWWVDTSTDESVRRRLLEALQTPESSLLEMGRRGRIWALSELSWPVVADRMLQAYEFARSGSLKPSFVY